jgi:predicted enzyme related to lactoylglutathione lyase
MARVVHFEIHAEQPERAIAFYTSLFSWQFTAWNGGTYWLINTGADGTPGINGGLVPRRGSAPKDGQPVNAFCCTVDVESVDDSVKRIGELGGSIALPKMPIPGVGWLAYGKDPEGNIFGVMEADSAAA